MTETPVQMRHALKFEVIKEPRGFIKIVQICVAIVAFGSCTAFHGYVELKQTCHITTTYSAGARFKYPFKQTLIFQYYDTVSCSKLMIHQVPLDYKGRMQYYVIVGVFCLLYSLGALAYYILMEPEQRQPSPRSDESLATKIELVISVIIMLFWFTSAVAFATAVFAIKKTTDVSKIITKIPGCNSGSSHNSSCVPTIDGNYAPLDASIVVGFLSLGIWCINLWFLFRETDWYGGNGNRGGQMEQVPNSEEGANMGKRKLFNF